MDSVFFTLTRLAYGNRVTNLSGKQIEQYEVFKRKTDSPYRIKVMVPCIKLVWFKATYFMA